MTYSGVFFGYWFSLAFMAYTFYLEPTSSGSTYATKLDATWYYGGYAGLCLVDILVTVIFVPDIVEYADKVNEAEALAAAKEENAKNSSSSSSS